MLRARALPECLSALTWTTSMSRSVRSRSEAMFTTDVLPVPNPPMRPIVVAPGASAKSASALVIGRSAMNQLSRLGGLPRVEGTRVVQAAAAV